MSRCQLEHDAEPTGGAGASNAVAEAPQPSSRRRRLVALLRGTISIAVVAYFYLSVDVSHLRELGRGVAGGVVAVVVVLSLARVVIAAWRFHVLLSPHRTLPFRVSVEHWFVGSFFNHLMPTSIGGDAVRVLLLRAHGVPPLEATALVGVERGLGMLMLALLPLFAAPFAPLPQELRLLCLTVAGSVVSGTLLIVALVRQQGTRAWLPASAQRVARMVVMIAGRPSAMGVAAAATLAHHACAVSTTWIIAHALGVTLDPVTCLALVPLVYLATALPITIGGVGLRELVFVGLLGPVGVPTAASLGVSLGTYATLVIPGAVGAALWLRRRGPA